MRRLSFFLLFIVWTSALACPQPGWAEDRVPKKDQAAAIESESGKDSDDAAPNKKENDRGPINIKTDHFDADDKKKIAVLTGNVIVSWENFVLTSDKARVFYREVKVKKKGGSTSGSLAADADTKGSQNSDSDPETEIHHEIVRIETEGNVKITMDNRVALAEQAVYEAEPRILILTGSPRVWRGEDFLSGERITVYLDDNRSVVEGGADKKVNATFYRPEKKEDGTVTEKKDGEGSQ